MTARRAPHLARTSSRTRYGVAFEHRISRDLDVLADIVGGGVIGLVAGAGVYLIRAVRT